MTHAETRKQHAHTGRLPAVTPNAPSFPSMSQCVFVAPAARGAGARVAWRDALRMGVCAGEAQTKIARCAAETAVGVGKGNGKIPRTRRSHRYGGPMR